MNMNTPTVSSPKCSYFATPLPTNECKTSPKRILLFILAVALLATLGIAVLYLILDGGFGLTLPDFMGYIAEGIIIYGSMACFLIFGVLFLLYLKKK
jgi:hypothetical protein